MKLTKKSKMLMAVLVIAIVVYTVVLFVVCGFEGHGAEFWISFAFVMISFLLLAIGGAVLGSRGLSLKDWLFGLPLVKHSAAYIAFELVISTVFIVLGYHTKVKWGLVFAPQFIALGVYLVFAISCLLAKQTIDDVQTKVSDKTTFIRLLKVDADMLVERAASADAKKVFSDFSEAVEYSDPMSSEALFELEKDISLAVAQAGEKLSAGDETSAIALCKKASLLLSERNKKTRALK